MCTSTCTAYYYKTTSTGTKYRECVDNDTTLNNSDCSGAGNNYIFYEKKSDSLYECASSCTNNMYQVADGVKICTTTCTTYYTTTISGVSYKVCIDSDSANATACSQANGYEYI